MSRFHGRQGKGAMRPVRALKREEAEERNRDSSLKRRRQWRLRHKKSA